MERPNDKQKTSNPNPRFIITSARWLVNVFRKYREQIYSRWVVSTAKIECDDLPVFKGKVHITNDGVCKIGKSLLVRSGYKHNPTGLYGGEFVLVIENGAQISIGSNVGISNSTIYCRNSITIGDRVLIGTDCKIYDTDFHSVWHADRAVRPEILGKCAPVSIGNDVFIGTGTIILRGVSIGDRSVIGAASVVTSPVPADEVWAGNPAKKIRKLN